MRNKQILIFILLALALLVTVARGLAVEENFAASSPNSDIYACACSTGQNSLLIQNTGTITSVYTLSQEGDASAFTALSASDFSLRPGESKEAYNFYSVPCGITGKFNLDTKISTVFGAEKTLSQSLTVRQCENSQLYLKARPESACPCEPIKAEFTLKNSGDFVEKYALKITPDTGIASLSEELVILGPGQQKDIYTFITPACGTYGQLDFVLHATAEKNGLTVELPFSTTTNMCYDYEVSAPEKVTVCKDAFSLTPISVKNKATIANTYALSTSPKWVKIENPLIDLKGGQTGSAIISIEPKDVEPGVYEATLSAITARGSLEASTPVQIEVQQCYSLDLQAEDVPALVSCEKYEAEAVILNDGSLSNNYSLSLEGSEWVSSQNRTYSILPQQSSATKIYIDAPCDASGKYEVEITAQMDQKPGFSRTVKMPLMIYSVEESRNADISAETDSVKIDYGGGALPLVIKNIGVRPATYSLNILVDDEPSSWARISQNRITLAPGSNAAIDLILAPVFNETEEGKYKVTVDAVLEGFETDSGKIAYGTDFKVKLQELSFSQRLSEWITNYWLYLVIGLASLVIFIIVILLIINMRNQKEYGETLHSSDASAEAVLRKSDLESEQKILTTEQPKTWHRKLFAVFIILLMLAALIAGGYALVKYGIPALTPVAGRMMNSTSAWMAGPQVNETAIVQENITINETLPVEVPESQNQSVEDSTIFIDRTGLRGNGNVVEIGTGENVTIPVTIQNNEEEDSYIIKISETVDWITTSRRALTVPPQAKGVLNIIVTPGPEVETGDYSITLTINVPGKQPIVEEIVLRITKETPFWQMYKWYLLVSGAILALLSLAAIISRWRQKHPKTAEPHYSQPKQETAHLIEDQNESKRSKRWIVGILLLLIIAGIVAAGILYGPKAYSTIKDSLSKQTDAEGNTQLPPVEMERTDKAPLPQPTVNKTNETVSPPPALKANQSAQPSREQTAAKPTELFVQTGMQTIIPLVIKNTNKTSLFKIKVSGGTDWIYIEDKIIRISPNESRQVNLIINPDENITTGDYRVDVAIEGQNAIFTKTFILNVRTSRYSDLLSYLIYALAGIMLLTAIILYLRKKDRESAMPISQESYSGKKSASKDTKHKARAKTKISLK